MEYKFQGVGFLDFRIVFGFEGLGFIHVRTG